MMILSAGLRTDIPAYYAAWFFRRLKEGFVYSRNPLFPHKITEYSLAPEHVDAIYFCSKNYAPMLSRLDELEGFRTLFHATLNAYGPDLEPHSPAEEEKLAVLRLLSAKAGKRRVVWRYDPIVLTNTYSVAFHLDAFARLSRALAPYVSGCVVNFAEIGRETAARIPGLLHPMPSDRRALMAGIGAMGQKFGIPIRICGRGEDYSALGVSRGGCVTLQDIARANACGFKTVRHSGNKRGCDCIPCRDIGGMIPAPPAVPIATPTESLRRSTQTSPRTIPTPPFSSGGRAQTTGSKKVRRRAT